MGLEEELPHAPPGSPAGSICRAEIARHPIHSGGNRIHHQPRGRAQARGCRSSSEDLPRDLLRDSSVFLDCGSDEEALRRCVGSAARSSEHNVGRRFPTAHGTGKVNGSRRRPAMLCPRRPRSFPHIFGGLETNPLRTDSLVEQTGKPTFRIVFILHFDEPVPVGISPTDLVQGRRNKGEIKAALMGQNFV
jgi:hypothetical protein